MRLIDADKLREDWLTNGENEYIYDTNAFLDSIDEQPTVDAAPVVHGRWIPLEYDGFADGNPVWDLWECSECGEEHSGDEDTLTPYCPNCGAKMDGREDNEA